MVLNISKKFYTISFILKRYVANCELEAAKEQIEPQPAWMAKEKKNLLCPVCREVITEEVSFLSKFLNILVYSYKSVLILYPRQ